MKNNKLLVFVGCLFLASCKSIGPTQIQLDRGRYNDAIINTHSEQLLRNIVRLRYVKPVSFIKITSVTSSYTLNPSINGSFSILNSPGTPGNALSGVLNPSISYSDQPTISYVPVSGVDFIKRMLLPVPLENLGLLLNGGIDNPQGLFNIIINHMGKYDNASNASDLRTVAGPQYKRFRYLTSLFNQLNAKTGAELTTAVVNKKMVLDIHFSKKMYLSKQAKEMKKWLRVPLNSRDILLTNETKLTQPNMVNIQIRSLLSAMIFLSHGVHAPQEHIASKMAPEYFIYPTTPFDWDPLMKGIFNVYASRQEPINAYVKIYWNNYWFYIAGNDIASIQSFSYIDAMHILTSGSAFENQGQMPILTIPTR
ncbi:MAG: hypothetical protein NTW08_07425 [Gammaproteobacteria bacterium]|nr:hypothetical protein [Gammaproteobacteria bacterium]